MENSCKLLFGVLIIICVTLVNISHTAECGHEEFASCAEPLDKLQLATEFQIGENEKLNDLCLELKKSLTCIQSFTRRCLNIDQRDHFNKMYNGTNQFIRDLCNNENFQQEYLKHSTCSQIAKDEFEMCAKRYKDSLVFIRPISNEENQENITFADNIKTICCSYQELIECSEEAAKYKCGNDAAKFVRDLLSRFGTSLVKLHCDNYSQMPELCGLRSTASSFQQIISILSLVIAGFRTTFQFIFR